MKIVGPKEHYLVDYFFKVTLCFERNGSRMIMVVNCSHLGQMKTKDVLLCVYYVLS